ncbi:MAG: hypothetical protein KC561_06270 [Myxococcales bacterium]|nr:hypothetical protein [Myxococcales bacterium]
MTNLFINISQTRVQFTDLIGGERPICVYAEVKLRALWAERLMSMTH